jgi:hypothetical protein
MQEKDTWPKAVAEFLLDNLAILLTIGFAGYIIYRQEIAQTAVSTDELLTAILAVLALLATSEIIERYRRLNSIERTVKLSLAFLESRLAERPSALAFFTKPPSLDSYIQGAQQIDLCGVTLTSTINKQFGNLRERLQAGAKIRILVVDPDPDSVALRMSAERSASPDDIEYHRVRLDATLREIQYLFKSWEESKSIQTGSSPAGSLAVKVLSYAPSFSILSFNAHRGNGVALVEVYPHKYGYKTPPTFDLTPKKDGDWYRYFVEQFDEMWEPAKPWYPTGFANEAPAG